MGRSALRTYESLTFQECYHGRADSNLNNGCGLCSLANRSILGMNQRTRTASVIAQSVISRHPSKSALRACETAAASGAVVAVSLHQASRLSAPLGATVLLRSRSRGQARSGQDWRDAGNIGRWHGTSTVVRAALTAALGRWPADGLVRSSRGFCYGHWPAWGAVPVAGVRGTGPGGAQAEFHPGAQTARFRSHWHDEVATTDLLVDERAQARPLIEDQHCR